MLCYRRPAVLAHCVKKPTWPVSHLSRSAECFLKADLRVAADPCTTSDEDAVSALEFIQSGYEATSAA